MKRSIPDVMKKLTCLLFAFFICQSLTAQTVVEIPLGNAGSPGASNAVRRKPLGSNYGFERSAFIYKASEIGAAGSITAISFFCDTLNNTAATQTAVRIFMKEISSSAFQQSTFIHAEEKNTFLVFNGVLKASDFAQNNFITINLNSPFAYSGTNNLELIVETNAGGNGNELPLSKGFRNHKTGTEKLMQYWQSDKAIPSSAGTIDYYRPNIKISLSPLTTCTGMPNAGNAVSSKPAVCTGVMFELNLVSFSQESGIAYQWQSSTDGVVWYNLSGATAPFQLMSTDSTRKYRCILNCNSQISYSVPVEVTINLPVDCYCYAGLGGDCSTDYAIDSVGIETTPLNNPHTGCGNMSGPNYSSFPATGITTCTLQADKEYKIALRMKSSCIVSMWIDYDQNGMFDITEWKRICTTSQSNTPVLVSFKIPSAKAKNGITGLRIRSRAEGTVNDSTHACSNFATGETEDYHITITGGTFSVEEKNKELHANLMLFPNPTSGQLTLQLQPTQEKALIQVFDVRGSLVYEETFINTHPLKIIDLKTFENGIYVVRVMEKEKMSTAKLILQKD